MSDKVKIFDMSWHLGAQYEFLKFPNVEWSYLTNNVRPNWNKKYRDIPESSSITYVPYYEPGKYDMAIVHIDQATVDYDPRLAKGKNTLAMDVNNEIQDIPKVVANHGTPYWPELYSDPEGKYSQDWLIEKAHKFANGNLMVVNSHRAKDMWRYDNSRVIIHGLTPSDWIDEDKEARIITTIAPAGWDSYYGRSLHREVVGDLQSKYGIKPVHVGVDFMAGNFDEYKEFIGRSLIYFNPTKESCMPRARTEAMFSGACVVSTAHHGAEDYFNCNARDVFLKVGEWDFMKVMEPIIMENYKNITGFVVPENPNPITELLAWLYAHYDIAKVIGQNGKKVATEDLNHDRFQKEWAEVIKEKTGKEILK